jgi:hypothetical protein
MSLVQIQLVVQYFKQHDAVDKEQRERWQSLLHHGFFLYDIKYKKNTLLPLTLERLAHAIN